MLDCFFINYCLFRAAIISSSSPCPSPSFASSSERTATKTHHLSFVQKGHTADRDSFMQRLAKETGAEAGCRKRPAARVCDPNKHLMILLLTPPLPSDVHICESNYYSPMLQYLLVHLFCLHFKCTLALNPKNQESFVKHNGLFSVSLLFFSVRRHRLLALRSSVDE